VSEVTHLVSSRCINLNSVKSIELQYIHTLHWLCAVADINKFLWMVRIGGSTDRGRHIKEADYYTPQGEFRVDKEGSPTLLNCLMYKMCYYRFGSVYTEQGQCTLHSNSSCFFSCFSDAFGSFNLPWFSLVLEENLC